MQGSIRRSGNAIATMLVCMCSGGWCLAQQDTTSPYPKVTIASPTAASLGKYTDFPVSYHTGVPQISIPIYTVKEGPLSLPISLSYHAGGIKVMEPASWVGTGWSLQAGGMISRVVRGAPDEAGTTGVGQYGHFSHYGFSSYLTQTQANIPYDQGFANGVYDGEPDLFTFSFNGYSGKFYFDDDRKPVLVNGEDLRVEYYYPRDTAAVYTAQSANIQGFILTDATGTRYYFGITPGGSTVGAAPVEMTYSFSGNPGTSDRLYSSWFLHKIESADRLFAIKLSYEAERYSYYTLSMFPVDPSAKNSFPLDSAVGTIPVMNGNEYKLVKNYMEGVRLSGISFTNGVINLSPGSLRTDLGNSLYSNISYTDYANTEARTLESISITNNQGFCKKFQFYYSYFNSPAESLPGFLSYYTINTDRSRLRLDSLSEQACNNSLALPPYKFVYHGNSLPRRLSFGQDHWGYANNVTNNTGLVPTYSINNFEIKPGADRDPAWPAMQQGTLQRIVYPTGGYTAYVFEPHSTWINCTRYVEQLRYSYSVGYDGSNLATFPGLSFSGSYYRIVLNNAACPPNTSGCAAGATLVSGATSLHLIGAPGNKIDTVFMQIPAGVWTLNLSRAATQTGTGAGISITEISPQQVQENAMVGGLRIKTIVQKENLATVDSINTHFEYSYNGRSTGILYGRPVYVQLVRNDVVKMFGMAPHNSPHATHDFPNGCMGPEVSGNNVQKYYRSAAPVFPMSTSQGNHIGYNEVKVLQKGNGYRLYRYYGSDRWDLNTDDIAYRNVNPGICNPATPNSPAAPAPYEYQRGELKQESVMSETGSLLQDSWYTIEFDSTLATPAYMVGLVNGFMLGNTYELRGYRKKRTIVTSNVYMPQSGLMQQTTQMVYHESPYHNQTSRKVVIRSAGDTQTTVIRYAADFRISTCDTITSGVIPYNNACNICNITMANTTTACSTIGCRYLAWINNILCRARARQAYISKRRNAFTNPASAYETCIQNAKNAADVNLQPILQLQQQAAILPIENVTWKNNSLLDATYFSYDYMTSPVGQPYLAKGRKINLATPSSTFNQAVTAPNRTSIVMDSRYEDDASLKHAAGNLVQVTLKDGVSNSYVWDYQNTLPVAKVSNAAPDQIAYTSFETNSYGGWTLNSGSVSVPGGFTGTKSVSGGINKTVQAGNYLVAVWCIGDVYVNGQLQTQAPVKTLGTWKCFEANLNNVTSVNVSGSLIDEVRLHPQGALMTTFSHMPLVGIVAQVEPDNEVTRYEYDALGRLRMIRNEDQQIVKQIDYQFQAPTHANALWQSNGVVRCKPCAANPAFETGMLQNLEKDVNPNSNSYDSARWVDAGIHSTCDAVVYWQFTASPTRCKQNGGANTGEREREQRDMNPCSPSYNAIRWLVVDTNTIACPLPPPPCNSSTCGANSQKCVGGVCETGVEVVVSSVYKKVPYQGGPFVWKWECTRRYCFSDGTSSTYSWLTWHDSPCSVGSCNAE
ncbi:hypothetical protein [Paraflavitalea sp. CAU 1676]|uniref:hypothetical protein n=1 Tax=Paraflavitalea sp. CAU 1676 TaxID=3032598 RepID=UPI0023DC608F|nr:hypothetical protein [Paraflavitalea sp. CAU 1676]MDF2191498.1 hypothetical protein [Paraflavitalea sp. CAU 1676]